MKLALPPRNPLLSQVWEKRLTEKMLAGDSIRIAPSPIPAWSYIYIGSDVAIGCPEMDAGQYLNEIRNWRKYLLSL